MPCVHVFPERLRECVCHLIRTRTVLRGELCEPVKAMLLHVHCSDLGVLPGHQDDRNRALARNQTVSSCDNPIFSSKLCSRFSSLHHMFAVTN